MPSRLPKNHGARGWLSEYAELCAQIDAELNEVDPTEVRYGSGRALWWRCENGPDHVWRQRVCNRTRGGGCPFCAGAQVSITNCLATRDPAVAAEWHPHKNGARTPRDFVAGSTHVAWWKCERGGDGVAPWIVVTCGGRRCGNGSWPQPTAPVSGREHSETGAVKGLRT